MAPSQHRILDALKTRGPQSVRILARRLDMTSMGVRQHLAGLEERALVEPAPPVRQTRGRPVRLWRLTGQGHRLFPDGHAGMLLDMIEAIRAEDGDAALARYVAECGAAQERRYRRELDGADGTLRGKLERLVRLRSEEGYMAELRLLPDGWLLIEHHCPILAAARACGRFCGSELELFRGLLAGAAAVTRTEHALDGARRCAYRIRPVTDPGREDDA